MFYSNVKSTNDPARTAQRLLNLQSAMTASGVPAKRDDRMLLATWNIREFDSTAYGERSLECLYYIAEICSHFDVIAIQEVREDLKALDKVQDIMGERWQYVVSDVTEGDPGNRERMAFLYDSKKVRFSGIAGEVVIPPIEIKGQNNKTIRYDPSEQLYRTPYLVGFRCGWCTFMLCTVHILYGKDTPNNPKRVREIQLISEFLARRARERKDYSNLILLGDFNIYKKEDDTMSAITDAGFQVPPELMSVPNTNTGAKKRFYDQIAFFPKKWRMATTGRAGVFNFFNTVYTDSDQSTYISDMGAAYKKTSKGKTRDAKGKKSYFRTYWRTHQMSDHLPMWIEIQTDFRQDYLQDIISSSE